MAPGESFGAANVVTAISTPGAQTGTVTYGAIGSATYSITLTCNGGSAGGSTNITVTPSPIGSGISFSPTTVSLPGMSNSVTFTLIVTSSATTPAGTYVFTVTSSSNGNKTTGNINFVVSPKFVNGNRK